MPSVYLIPADVAKAPSPIYFAAPRRKMGEGGEIEFRERLSSTKDADGRTSHLVSDFRSAYSARLKRPSSDRQTARPTFQTDGETRLLPFHSAF